jgi:hypothetical protein
LAPLDTLETNTLTIEVNNVQIALAEITGHPTFLP